MTTKILLHAKQRLDTRFSHIPDLEKTVINECDKRANEIRQYRSYYQVLVEIKSLPRVIRLSDGSTGDIIVAAIDPKNMEVKTVMLRLSDQKDKAGTKRI